MDIPSDFPNIPNEIFKEILSALRCLNLLVCETHEEKKLIYSFKSREFYCPSCYLKSPNLDKSSKDVIDLKFFLNKNYIKTLVNSLNKGLTISNAKVNNSLYKSLQNFLSDFKALLKKSFEEISSSLKRDFEKASEEIDRVIMGINLDSLAIRSQEAIKTLKEYLAKGSNLINVDTFSQIMDIKDIIDSLNELNYPLFEEISDLQRFQKEKLEHFEHFLMLSKANLSSLFSLELDFSKIRTSYTLNLKSIVQKEDRKNLKSNMYYGNVLMDSRSVNSQTVYCFPDYINIAAFFQFDGLEDFKHFNGKNMQLPCHICGVYNVVFNGYLYARKEPYLTSNTIVKVNLESLRIENEKVLDDFVPQETINGWSLYNSHFFLANREDIFLVYGSSSKETLQTIKINPLTLEIERKYEIGLRRMGFDAVFFDGRSVNVVQGNKVAFKYDLYRELREDLNISFNPPYSHYNLYYCVQQKALWALYPKSMAVYELRY